MKEIFTGAARRYLGIAAEFVGTSSAEPLAQRKSSIKRSVMVIFGFVMCAGWVESASSAVVFMNNRAGFEASLSSLITDDYENPGYVFNQNDAVMSGVIGETAYTATGFSNVNLVPSFAGGHYYCAGCNGSFLLDFTSTSIGNASGVDGIGFNFFNRAGGGGPYHAFVTFGDNSTTNFALPAIAFSDPFTAFWGITSALSIQTIHLGLANGGTTQGGSFGLDNLTIGATQVPEPTTLTLFGLGLAGLGFARRRKKRAT